MKKTLVALAVLAASGASFAQVTVTGEVAMGYSAQTNSLGANLSGLGVDTAAVNFKVSEDLGGGYKTSAVLGASPNRAGVSGNDTALSLVTPGGIITLASIKLTDYTSNSIGNVTAGYARNDFANNGGPSYDNFFSTGTNYGDAIVYTVPVGQVTLSLTHAEVSLGSPATLGLGVGAAGYAGGVNQRVNSIAAAYNKNGLGLDAHYLSWDNRGNAVGVQSTLRLAASYDLGVAKVGAAGQQWTTVAGNDTQLLVSVSVPFGAANVGAAWVNENNNAFGFGSTAALAIPGARSGYSLVAAYNLSKQTSIQAQYMSYQATQYNGTSSSVTEIALVKDF